jgi:PhnB protein
MRFMIIRKADAETEAGAKASEALIEAMASYNEEMLNAGVLRGGDGLHPSARGARVKFAGGTPMVTDGPFTEAKELIAGYTMIEVASREEAIEWMKRWPPLDGHGNVELELRQVYELEELGAGEGIEHHARLREQLAAR